MQDPRKIALKAGLDQLTVPQLERILWWKGPLLLDRFNYRSGVFCPLAIGLGLDTIVKEPTQDRVHAIMTLAGYTVNNTSGIDGEFYTTNRYGDLIVAITEVLREKKVGADHDR